ncbi:hypothetical protein ACP70R_030736 [Stipagrostis hirtigluma subsp. patula]
MGSIVHGAGGEMCVESGSGGGRAAARRGGKKTAAEQKASKQPQRGLGVAQLEKIRLHNQMVAAYRSGHLHAAPPHQDVRMQVPFAAPSAAPVAGGGASFQQLYLTDHGIAGVQYYDNLLPFGSSRPPPPFGHGAAELSAHGGQPHHCWTSTSHGSGHGGAEELDLELRL